MHANEPFNLARFVEAQEGVYDTAIREIRDGRKRTHWMWFIFPQIAGLGSSSTARFYAIRSGSEAEAYLSHPILGPRLVACAEAALSLVGRSADEIFGDTDSMKLRSSATLFATVSAPASVFHRLLDRFFGGELDHRTVSLLAADSADPGDD